MKYLFLVSRILCYFYDFPLDLWNETIRHVGPGNHPDVYHFMVGKGACPNQPQELGMYGNASMTYGTQYKQVCLQLDTGMVLAYERIANPQSDKSLEIKPSDSNQFEYLKGLEFLRSVANTVRKGHTYHPRPERPRLEAQKAVEYCTAASKQHIQRVGGVVGLWFPREVEYDADLRLYLEYQVQEDADILLEQSDKLELYSEQRFDAYGDSWNATSVVVRTPRHVRDTSSFKIKVAVVPRGKPIQNAFYVTEGTTTFLKMDRVQYLFCTYRPTLGSTMRCSYNVKVSAVRDIQLSLQFHGIVYAEIKRASNDVQTWEVALDSSWPIGNYQVIAQLLDGAQWLDEKVEPVVIVASK
jgi:hypothetical protein